MNIHVLCLTEHWLQHTEMLNHIENYIIGSYFTRECALRGGSLIFIKNNVKFKERKDIISFSIERIIEISCVELEQLVIICVYRPPSGSYDLFETTMESVLHVVSKNNKKIAVCGDFNINILETSSHSVRFLSLFQSFNLHHTFYEPTRVTPTSATCLDNFFCNCKVFEKEIVNCINSDHSGQKITIEHHFASQSLNITYRPITDSRLKKFRTNIGNKFSLPIDSRNDPNSLYSNIIDPITHEFDNIFKHKTITIKATKKFSDWATPGIYRSRRKMYELYKLKSISRDLAFINYVRNYSKIFKKVCQAAKAMCISSQIKNSDNKIKTTWKVINKEICKVKCNDRTFSLNINDKCIKSDNAVASTFESFFSEIPNKITKGLNSNTDCALALLASNVTKCDSFSPFNFRHISEDTIVKTFKSLNKKKTEDLWGISVSIIQSIITIISPQLTVLFNKCIDECTFPTLMKYSKIIPLFKAGDRSDPTNYRPISILPALSKIFEKVIFNQLLSHFIFNKLFHNKQFGFTKGRNTTDAGIALMKHVYDAWEGKSDALGIFCDLSKAFDCVEHETLLGKLKYYGVSIDSIRLIRSYLSDRKQIVVINKAKSLGAPTLMGVPQGSILGPLLFLIYINDLPYHANKLCDTVLFADDTSLIFKIDRSKANFDDVNSAVSKVLHWFTTNNLLLNPNKTKCIKFSLPNVRQVKTEIKINNDLIQCVDSTSFLGIIIDSKLQWKAHIAALSKRLSSAIYAVKKIRLLSDIETARLVYFSYFHSVMSYGLLLWGSAADINDIFILQKRAIRAIYVLKPRQSIRDLFKEINILTVASQYIYDNILYVHKYRDTFLKHSDIHKFNTRNCDKLAVPKFRLHKTGNTFFGKCIQIYNKLPLNVTKLPLHKLKQTVKVTLMKQGYYKVEDYLEDKNIWK
jgi:hypothetical protein